MDQKELYELQTGTVEAMAADDDIALIGRDHFVTDYMAACTEPGRLFSVAELSIGEGRLTRSLLQCFPDIQLNCIDISTNRINYVRIMLEATPELDGRNVTFSECNFDTQFVSIEGASYDFVIALDIMEHVLDVFSFVEHCHRILVKDGILFLRVPNIAYIKHRLRLLRGKLPVTASWFETPEELTAWRNKHGWDGGHLHLFTVPVLYSLLEDCDFRVEYCRDPGTKLQGLRNVLPTLLYANPLIVARKLDS